MVLSHPFEYNRQLDGAGSSHDKGAPNHNHVRPHDQVSGRCQHDG
jgi:hypothetical protein